MIRKELLVAAILAFVVLLSWVIFDILHERSKVEIPAKLEEQIEPISPEFNIKPLENLP